MHYVKLTDEQFETIVSALKADYHNGEALGALPIGAEIQDDIKSAYLALHNEKVLDKEDVEAIALTVVAHSRPGMRVAIGDSTPKQYDRADHMAEAIKRAVYTALAEIGLYDPEEEDAAGVPCQVPGVGGRSAAPDQGEGYKKDRQPAEGR